MSNTGDFFGGGGSYQAVIDNALNRLRLVNSNMVGMEVNFPPSIGSHNSSLILKRGGEYSRVAYPALWEWVQVHTNILKTEAEWQALKTSSPIDAVPYYSSGNGSTTFRVPTVGTGGFTRSLGSEIRSDVGTGFGSQIENHKHILPIGYADNDGYFGLVNHASIDNANAGGYGFEDNFDSAQKLKFSATDGNTGSGTTRPKSSPDTYDNTGETSPQGFYVETYIYSGNLVDNLPVPEPAWLTQQQVNTDGIANLVNPLGARGVFTIWEGTIDNVDTPVDFTESILNFDMIVIEGYSTESEGTNNIGFSDSVTPQQLQSNTYTLHNLAFSSPSGVAADYVRHYSYGWLRNTGANLAGSIFAGNAEHWVYKRIKGIRY